MKRDCDILAVCYGGGHVNMVVAIVEKLRESHPEISVTVLGLTNAQRVLEKHDIDYLGFRHLVTEADAAALASGARLAEDLTGGTLPPDETIAYLGLSYTDLERDLGAEEAARRYACDGRQAFLPVRTLERCIALLGPKVVLTTSAPRAERAAVLAARQSNIPAVCMVDLFASQEVNWLKHDDFADTICVLSDFVKEHLVNHGRNPAHVEVTGNPAFDRLADPQLAKAGMSLREQRGWGSKFVVLFASQPEPATDPVSGEAADVTVPARAEEALIRCVEEATDLHLVVRYHPSQDKPRHPNSGGNVTYSSQQEDLAILLHAVDCVVTFSSTVGLEAAMEGKPLLALQMSVTSASVPYVRMGIAEPVARLEDLGAAIGRVRQWRHRRAAVLPEPGGAAGRIVDILLRHLHASTTAE